MLLKAQQGKIIPPETQHIAGGFGHGFYTQGANGYGGMNITTAQAMTAWSLMERCGMPVTARCPQFLGVLNIRNASVISSSLCRLRHRTCAPGGPSLFRFKNPPSLAIQSSAVFSDGATGGCSLVL